MNVAIFIAGRYFISKKKRNFINFISGLSVIGVAVGTVALIVVLSVFNGLEDLIKSIYGSFDPHLKVKPYSGKSFEITPNVLSEIKKIDGITFITEVIEDHALVKYNDKQTIILMKGVSANFDKQYNIANYVLEGKPSLTDQGLEQAIIGRGVQYKLGIDMQNRFYQLQFWYPKNLSALHSNPDKAFNSANLFPGGIFALEKQYDDNYVFVPIGFAQSLMQYGNKRTSLEINTKPDGDIHQIKKRLSDLLGDQYNVLTRDEQHVEMLRAVKIEKLFVYVTFSFIILVSSLNIFFTLSMLAIEKKHDMDILFAMGATPGLIRNIFLAEGFTIAVIGAVAGLAGGYLICYLQQTYGFVSMGAETSLVNAYPVKMKIKDFIFSAAIIMIITFLISYQPASKAAKEVKFKI